MFATLVQRYLNRSSKHSQGQRHCGEFYQHLSMESLEKRCMLTSFIVSNTDDAGLGSFRQAITDANSNPGDDTILFNIAGGGIQTIEPLSALPAITDTLAIDGHSQTVFGGDINPFGPEIVLDGSNILSGAVGLSLIADGNQVQGMNIQQFGNYGVSISGDGLLNNMYSSQLTLADSAEVGVSLINAGRLEIGASPGTATVNQYTQTLKGTIAIELGGTTSGDYDRLLVDGTATLGGNLAIDLLSPFIPDSSDVFTILFSSSLNGSFVNVANGGRLETSDGNGSFKVIYSRGTGKVRLSEFSPMFSADFDADGDVDRGDLELWKTSYGFNHMMDADIDADADGFDFLLWQWQNGSGMATVAAAGMAVPEPAAGLLGVLTLALLLLGPWQHRMHISSADCNDTYKVVQ